MSVDGNRAPLASGFGLVLLATAIAGAAGYAVTWLVPRAVGFAEYPPFAVFWAFLFLVISALSGIQQEITRATSPAVNQPDSWRRLLVLAASLAAAVLALVLCTAPLWQSLAFPDRGWALVLPLGVGAASYVGAAVVYGSLYGTGQWRTLFWLISTEAVLRLAAIVVTLSVTADLVALTWAVAAPIPVALLALAAPVRRALRGSTRLDVGSRQLLWNFARTVVAAASLGVLVSGLPLVIGLTSTTEPSAPLGLFISVMTLTRAPLIVVALALQSYFIVLFQSSGSRLWSVFLRMAGIVVAVGAVLAVAGYLAGPTVFAWLFPDELVPSSLFVAGLVGSSVLVGLLCLSGPAVLAQSRHVSYSLGWLAAAVVTIVSLMLPIGFAERTTIALALGPVAGLLVHLVSLVSTRLRERGATAE